MLLRLISVISLFKFMLLLISGTAPAVALYRSIIVFMILFTVIYLGIFFLNVIRENPNSDSSTVTDGNNKQTKNEA